MRRAHRRTAGDDVFHREAGRLHRGGDGLRGRGRAGGRLGRADAAFVKDQTGFSIGGVSPVAHLNPPVTLIDQDLFRFEVVWAAAGHPHAVFPLAPADLVRWTGAPVADVVVAI